MQMLRACTFVSPQRYFYSHISPTIIVNFIPRVIKMASGIYKRQRWKLRNFKCVTRHYIRRHGILYYIYIIFTTTMCTICTRRSLEHNTNGALHVRTYTQVQSILNYCEELSADLYVETSCSLCYTHARFNIRVLYVLLCRRISKKGKRIKALR